MAGGYGSQSKLALVKGSTWGTAVALGSGHRYPFVSTGLKRVIEQIADDSLLGQAERAVSWNGNEVIGPAPIVSIGDYRQHLLQAAAFMGAAGVPTTVETGVYKHVLPWTASVDGLFLSAGLDIAGKDVHGFNSIKAMRRLIQVAAGGRMEESYEYVGRGIDKTLSSGSWTYTTDPNGTGARLILHRHGVWRINTAAGGALGGSDKVYPTRMEIDLNRAHGYEFAQAALMEEPIPGDWASLGVRLDFFAVDAALLALFLDNRDADTPMKMDAVFTYPTLLGATQYPHRAFYFPLLKIVDVDAPVTGPGRVSFSVSMTAHKNSAVPTGFPTGYDEAVTEEWQNGLSADPLA